MAPSIRDGQFAQLPNGTRLHYASAGDPSGELLLFVHGFPEAWFEWEAQLAEFGHDHFAVAPDLRGFGRSSKPADVGQYKARLIVDDLCRFIAFLGRKSATVIAHDWGGAIAWNLAIFFPDVVQRLIILNAPHPYLFMRALTSDPSQQEASAYMNWLRQEGSEGLLAEDDFARLDGFFGGRGQKPAVWYTPEVQARYHEAWSIPGDGNSHPLTGGVNYYRASPLHPPVDGGMPAAAAAMEASQWHVNVPVRVLWGESDIALPKSLLDGLEAFCPDLRIMRVPEGSHWLVHEQPALVNRFIRDALKD